MIHDHERHQDSAETRASRGTPPAPDAPVLIVEDDPINQTLLTMMLIQLGHSTEVAGCGEDAVAMAGRSDYRAVLMDVMLPAMPGDEAAREIRRIPGSRGRVPIICMSGMVGEERRFREAGMDGHVAKPFSMSELEAVLGRIRPAQV